jgi:hypothetical protein
MATVETAIIARLKAHAGTAALVGTRVNRLVAPQGTTRPNIVVTRITPEPIHVAGADVGLRDALVQVDGYASENAVALQLRSAMLNALSRQGGTWDTVVVQQCFLENQIDEYEEPTRLYRCQQDYRVWYVEVEGGA